MDQMDQTDRGAPAGGQRLTRQRRLLLDILAAASGHLTADEVYQRVAPREASMSRSTVYRSLTALRDLGLVSETDLGGGVQRYELMRPEHHHHLVCLVCGTNRQIDGGPFEPLRAALLDGHGFVARLDHFALFGTCAACAASPPPSRRAAGADAP